MSSVRSIPSEGSAELARSEERIVSEVRLRAPTATMLSLFFGSKKPMAAEEKDNNNDDDDDGNDSSSEENEEVASSSSSSSSSTAASVLDDDDDEEPLVLDDDDEDDEEEEEEEVQTPWSTELKDVDYKDDDGQKDREYTKEELARASPKAMRRFNAWKKKVLDQAAGTALTYLMEWQDWEGWCRAEEGEYLKGYLVPHGKKRHGYLVRRVVEPFCNRSIHLP